MLPLLARAAALSSSSRALSAPLRLRLAVSRRLWAGGGHGGHGGPGPLGSFPVPARAAGLRPFSVLVSTEEGDHDEVSTKFRNRVKAGRHTLVADEPENLGGGDSGMSPYELLLSSLGACTSMTLKMYAERKGIALEGVCVQLDHEKVYLKDCEECVGLELPNPPKDKKGREPKIDVIHRVITLHGSKLTKGDRENLLRIANLCPVHKTLEASSVVTTKLKEEVEEKTDPTVGDTRSNAQLETLIHAKSHALVADKPAFTVRRVFPYRLKRAVGPFVFADHFGPVDVSTGGSMDVGPHPHIGISTLTYLFSGAIIHRDSTGAEAVIRPGEVNWMVAGNGVVHSERGEEAVQHIPADMNGRKMLHGMQCWVALPKEKETGNAEFHHLDIGDLPDVSDLVQGPVSHGGHRVRLVVGKLGNTNVTTGGSIPDYWPMFMADAEMECESVIEFPVAKDHELAVYVAEGRVEAGPEKSVLDVGECAVYSGVNNKGSDFSIQIKASEDARVVLFGGLPLPEPRRMFWNFVASEPKLIEEAASAWEAMDRTKFPEVVNEDNKDSIPCPPYRRIKG